MGERPLMRAVPVANCDICGSPGLLLYADVGDHWGVVPGLYSIQR